MKQVKIILTEEIDNLGSLGDEVKVKAGYARNFLLPQGKALLLSSASAKRIRHYKTILSNKIQEALEEKKSLGEKIASTSLSFEMKAGESGKLFGSVTGRNIMESLGKEGLEVERKYIQLLQPIKTLGSHVVPIKLHTSVVVDLNIKISSEGELQKEKEVDEPDVLPPEEGFAEDIDPNDPIEK